MSDEMVFTDEDVKRLKECISDKHFHAQGNCLVENADDEGITLDEKFMALLARLEAAEVLAQQLKDGHFPQPWAIEAWLKAQGKWS